MDTTKAELVTRKHMQRVSELLGEAACELIRRAAKHDMSKLQPIELYPLQKMQDKTEKYGQVPFDSDEYKMRLAELQPMLLNHYKCNSHHPEHYDDGVNGMDLFDVLEMLLDWKAASERGEESQMSIGAACDRFQIGHPIESILRNTAERLGYKTDNRRYVDCQ